MTSLLAALVTVGLLACLLRLHHRINGRLLIMKHYNHSYYVVMIDYGQRGLEAIVQPGNYEA